MTCKVIAEIGWNHMGDMVLAKEMISAAADSGADFAKFQTWSVNNLKNGQWDNDGRLEIYKKSELTQDQHLELIQFCSSKNIDFLTSAFNINDVDWLSKMDIKNIKIPSHEVYNKSLIEKVDGLFDEVFISTGAALWDEVKSIPSLVKKSKLCLFHCVSSYPCQAENVNLKRIHELRKINPCVGYSGHFFGIEDAVLSLCYDVGYVEKHFTIDRALPGRDNEFAILPDELKALVGYCKNYDSMNIDNGTDFQLCEKDVFNNYRGRWSK